MIWNIAKTPMVQRFKCRIDGKANAIHTDRTKLRNVSIDIIGRNNSLQIGEASHINNLSVQIHGSNNSLLIGSGCQFIDGGSFWIRADNCSLSIGDSTTIEQASIYLLEPESSVQIGNDCMFARGIDIWASDFHSVIDLASNQRTNFSEQISIEDHVWLGFGVVVLKGVRIGSNSIIGVRSVVAGDIPENSMAAGVPASVHKTNITWVRELIPRA